MSEFTEKFLTAMCRNGLEKFADEKLAGRFEALTDRMLEVNAHMNLTAITDTDGIIVKHYVDSLAVSEHIPEGSEIIDIGCGAGFPSLPLAIARPDLWITALDSTAKRINYINETAAMLRLGNLTAISARAEELSHDPDYREKYDVAVARAVARLNVLSELCVPYVKKGGIFIAMKAHAADEVQEAENAISKLGGKTAKVIDFTLNAGDEHLPRVFVIVSKVKNTPDNYPRNNSQITKKPL